MFTDTKNLAKARGSPTANDLTPPQSNGKSKGKLRKVWKPLLRLITLKTAAAKSGNSGCSSSNSSNSNNSNSITHPNNINLNNATSIKDIYELSTTMLEDYATAIRKAAPAEEFHYDAAAACQGGMENVTVICSASIEKTPSTSNCIGCVYGRNCQHARLQHNGDICQRSCVPVIEAPDADDTADVPVHYVHTDDGTFFWTTAQDRIDDDLLTAWLCHSFRQFPVQSTV